MATSIAHFANYADKDVPLVVMCNDAATRLISCALQADGDVAIAIRDPSCGASVAKESTMLQLGTAAPAFALPDYDGKLHRLSDFNAAKGLVVAFICNHCPYVKHVRTQFAAFARDYQAKGIAVVAITSNDVQVYPQDGPDGMRDEARSVGYTFPYLFDATQAIAMAYYAACTPDFYLFDSGQRLVYRGQFDASRPSNGLPVTGRDLRAACDALLTGTPIAAEQVPSIGCSIKWRPGHAPGYA